MLQQSATATSSLASSSSAALTTKDGVLKGFSITETAGTPAAAIVELRDGSSTGAVLAKVSLAASGSSTEILPNVGVSIGVYCKRVSGTTDVVVYT